MPYTSRKSYSRSYAKKKGYRKKPTKKITKSAVVKIAKQVANKSKPTREARFWLDNSVSQFHTNLVGNAFKYAVLTSLEQGDQDNQRTGDRIWLGGCKIRVSCTNPLTVPRALRVIVCQNRNANGDLLDVGGWSDLYTNNAESDSAATNKSHDITAPLNSNIRVFYDKTFHIRPNSMGLPLDLDTFVRINKKIVYDNLGISYSAVSSGTVFAIFHLIEPTDVLDPTPSPFSAMIRVFYKDA